MKQYVRRYYRHAALGMAAAAGFVALAQISQMHSEVLVRLTEHVGIVGIMSYIGLLVLAIVVAPISTGFLLPVAANSWGPWDAAVYSVVGWTIGACVAFWLSRYFGVALAARFGTVERMRAIASSIPNKRMVVVVFLMRLTFPVEIVSYTVGLFTTMRFIPYFVTTLFGIMPFTFLFAYASVGSVHMQVLAAVLGVLTFMIGVGYVVHHTVRMHTQHPGEVREETQARI